MSGTTWVADTVARTSAVPLLGTEIARVARGGVSLQQSNSDVEDWIVGANFKLPSAYVTNRTPANLKYWTRKLNRMMTLAEQPRINMYGDSLTEGSGGSLQANSPGQRMAEALTAKGIPAKANLYGFPFANTTQYTAFEPRTVFTGTWGGWTALQGTGSYRCTSALGSVTYSPGYSWNTCNLHWYRGGLFGSEGTATITLNGGATAFTLNGSGSATSHTLSMSGSAGLQQAVIVAAAGVHTITVTNGATLQIELYGFEAYTSTVGGVLIRCMGSPSLALADLVAQDRLQCISDMTCEMSMLCTGANDWVNGYSLATFATNLGTINTYMLVNSISDIVYWSPPPSATSVRSHAYQLDYVNALKTAASTTIVVADYWQSIVDLGGADVLQGSGTGGGWYNDTIHPNAYGNYDIGQFLANVLMRQAA